MKRRVYKYLTGSVLLTIGLSGGAAPAAEDGSAENAWPLCPSALPIPERPLVEVPLAPGETYITADEADLEENGISRLRGDAEITRDRQQVSADFIDYDETQESADLQGNVQYWDDDLYLAGERARVEIDDETGQFENAHFFIKNSRGRGEAEKIYHEYTHLSEFTTANYSTCDPEDNFWKISASKITLNHDKNRGTARNAVLRIKDVPVFYTPYISFPLKKERKTGFLFPSFGSSNRNGFEIQTPFYLNIAPEVDATITPRVLGDSGVMFMGQFRYLLDRGNGELNLEYLPNDDEFVEGKEDRSLLGFTHQQLFGRTGNLFLTYNRVSDKQYFEDFGSSINITSTQFLERRADASYSGNWWNAFVRLQDFQTVDSSIPVESRPFKRLPQVNFNAASPFRNRALNFNLRSEFTYFDRGDNDIFADDLQGARVDLFPSITYPIHTASTFFIPKAGFRYTQYELENTGVTFKSSPDRTLPLLSLDTGAFFDRDTRLFGTGFVQTLEPRLFYLYIPFEDQDDLPVFDTGLFDFSFDSLFREDRFNGVDRMGDANQATLAVTSRLINQRTGKEAGHISFGQIYFLRDREVTLPGARERDEDTSPLVAEIGVSILDDWRARGTIQWDPNNDRTDKLTALVQYNPAVNKLINLGYRKRDTVGQQALTTPASLTDIEQTDVSFVWPLTRQWNVIGRWNYALPESRSLDLFGGVEYESCCWAARVIARRFLTDVTGDFNTGIFFQLELKGLAGIGQSTEDFLRKNIPGFESEF